MRNTTHAFLLAVAVLACDSVSGQDVSLRKWRPLGGSGGWAVCQGTNGVGLLNTWGTVTMHALMHFSEAEQKVLRDNKLPSQSALEDSVRSGRLLVAIEQAIDETTAGMGTARARATQGPDMSVQGTIGFDLVWLDVYDTAKMREARKSYQELKGRLDSLTKMKKALTQYQSWLVQRQPATRK